HMPDPERAVLVSNHLRPWLPVLLSMNGNSPYWAGRDTGYASWRTLSWSGWPVAGPPPFFESLGHFDDTVETFVDGGALMDRRSIFWDVRPSAHLPTIEIRVADVAATSYEGPLFAALVRGLVALASQAVERGDRGPRIAPELLRAASWRAARDGLEGKGIDARTGRLRDTRDLVGALLAEVRPVLEAWGDWDQVTAWWRRLQDHGSGAARQRNAYARRGRLDDVVDCLIEQNQPGSDRDHPGAERLPKVRDPFALP
ncbi:MAG: carboxylate-amine ligase, partial [Stackebrandtia sp.]